MADRPSPGTPVPHHFFPPYIILSYLVSVVGCWTALEILSQQTAARGVYNWFLLACSATTMNAVGIWAMHFIGNAALIMGNNTKQDKISYYVPWTIASLILPVFVVGIAFWLLQRAREVNAANILLGGAVCGAAICGMHYSGQLGIANYTNEFQWPYVLVSALLASLAASLALGIFFLLKKTWNNAWWKRGIAAALLSAGVSSTHWVAIVGTNYTIRVVSPTAKLQTPAAGWICGVLAVTCCFVLLLFVIIWRRLRRLNLQRSKSISLALACTNPDGKLMLNVAGFIPSTNVTRHYNEQFADGPFEADHAAFIWFLRLSRNWESIAFLLPQIRRCVTEDVIQATVNELHREGAQESHQDCRRLKERLAVAAFNLRSHTHADVNDFGVLYDRILDTGTITQSPISLNPMSFITPLLGKQKHEESSTNLESVEDPSIVVGRGQMLFLVRHVDQHTQEQLEGQGYTFVSLQPAVIESIARSLQISTNELRPLLDEIREYPETPRMMEPGIYMTCFATRPSFSNSKWEILVQRTAHNLLPSIKLESDHLETWQTEILEASAGKNPETLRTEWGIRYRQSVSPMGAERRFLKMLLKAMNELGERVGEETFRYMKLTARPFFEPAVHPNHGRKIFAAQMIAFYGFADIHHRHPQFALDEFIPSNMVIAYQKIYPNTLHHVEFANSIRSDFHDLDFDPEANSRTSIAGLMGEYLPTAVRAKALITARVSRARLSHPISSDYRRSLQGPISETEGEGEGLVLGPVKNTSPRRYLDVSISKHLEVNYERAPSSSTGDGFQTPVREGQSSVQSEIGTALVQPSMVEQLLELTLNSRRRYPLSVH